MLTGPCDNRNGAFAENFKRHFGAPAWPQGLACSATRAGRLCLVMLVLALLGTANTASGNGPDHRGVGNAGVDVHSDPAEAVADPATSAYGVTVPLRNVADDEATGESERLLRRAGSAGLRWVRTDLAWPHVEAEQGRWDFNATDRAIERLDGAQMRIVGVLGGTVDWTEPAPAEMDAWLEYVRRVVERYSGRIRYWQVWDEPNAPEAWPGEPDVAAYTRLLKATATVIREVDGEARIVAPAVAGLDLAFIEAIYEAEGGDSFDVLAVGPQWAQGMPESPDVAAALDGLRELMHRHGDAGKPIWLSHLGWASASPVLFDPEDGGPWARTIRTGLNHLDPRRREWTLAVLDDPTYPGAMALPDRVLAQLLPGNGGIERVDLNELGRLSPRQHPALLLPLDEATPAGAADALLRYVREGGILISGHGAPLMDQWVEDADGQWRRRNVTEDWERDLRFRLRAHWMAGDVPRHATRVTAARGFEGAIPLPPRFPEGAVGRFIMPGELRGGDRFTTLLVAREGGFEAAVAATIRYGSDLRGGLVVWTPWIEHRYIRQDHALPRAYLIAFQKGIDRIFWADLHEAAGQEGKALLHDRSRDKPAIEAHEHLARMRPEGSVIRLGPWRRGDLFSPAWERPDGTVVHALWSAPREMKVRIGWDGPSIRITDHRGRPVDVQPERGAIEMQLGPGVLYIEGPETLSITAEDNP